MSVVPGLTAAMGIMMKDSFSMTTTEGGISKMGGSEGGVTEREFYRYRGSSNFIKVVNLHIGHTWRILALRMTFRKGFLSLTYVYG